MSIFPDLLSHWPHTIARMEFSLHTFRSFFVLGINSLLLFRLKNDFNCLSKGTTKGGLRAENLAFITST